MALWIITMLSSAVGSCLDWFKSFIDSSNFNALWITCFIIFTVSRFLLMPFVGHSMGSDSVKSTKIRSHIDHVAEKD